MQELRGGSLPPKLTAYRSMNDSLIASFNARKTFLLQCSGYPIPSHVVNMLRSYFDMTDLSAMKRNIVTLRNATKYASELLNDLVKLKVEKYPLESKDVHDYVSRHADRYGYAMLGEKEFSLVAYLITSSESRKSAWILEMNSDSSENFFAQMHKLYEDVTASKEVSPIADDEKSFIFDKKYLSSEQSYYDPSSDEVVPLSTLIYPPSKLTAASTAAINSTGGDRAKALALLNESYSSESTLFRLSDVRFLDHVFSLLMDTSIWDVFVTPRSGGNAEAENLARARGLKIFSAYLQSLLMYPHVFRYEVYRESYAKLEEWYGSMPTIPAHVIADYELLVRRYDFFDAKQDVSSLFSLYDVESDPNVGSHIYVQFYEAAVLFAAEDIMRQLKGIKAPDSYIDFSDIKMLRQKEYNHLLMGLPLERVDIMVDITRRINESSQFEFTSRIFFTLIQSGFQVFLNDETITALADLQCKVAIPWHGKMDSTFAMGYGVVPSISLGSFPMRYFTPFATSALDFHIQNKLAYSIGTASSLYTDNKHVLGYDNEAADKLRKILGRDWGSYYPASAFSGTRMRSLESYGDEISLKMLLEDISGDSYEVIKSTLNNASLLEVWATYLSSFALLFTKGSDGTAKVVEGAGFPYGTTYTDLAKKQKLPAKVSSARYMTLPGTELSISFLQQIPAPGDTFSIGEFYLMHNYYYNGANARTISVEHIVRSESLKHFALRSYKPMDPGNRFLFDKRHAYSADSLFVQINSTSSLRTEVPDAYVTKFPLSKKEWTGDRIRVFVDLISPPPYSHAEGGTVEKHQGQESLKVDKMIQEFEKDLMETHDDSKVMNPPTDSELKKIENEVLDEGKGSGGSTSTQSHDNPEKKEKKKDKDLKSEQEEDDKDEEIDKMDVDIQDTEITDLDKEQEDEDDKNDKDKKKKKKS